MAWLFAKSGGWNNDAYNCDNCRSAKHYTIRNCPKHFPHQPKQDFRWEPDFQTSKGSYFGVDPCECIECPVSYITPASRHLIQIEYQNQILKESTGSSLYGSDLSKWPSKTLDGFCRIASIRNQYDNARHEAEMDEIR